MSTIMLAAREARDQGAPAWPESRRAHRARRQGDVAELHSLLPVRHGLWARLLGPRRRRQPLPRLHRGDRRRHHGPLPPQGCGRDQGPGRPLPPHVGHRLLLQPRDRAGRTAGEQDPAGDTCACFLHQLGRRGHRGSDEAGCLHDRTFGALSLTASKASQRRRFAPLLSQVFHAPFPTASRNITTDQSIERIEELFNTVAPPESVAAVFVEPIQGEGGYLVPPDDFLPRLPELTRTHGILLVADEVQSGMGRTGQLLAVEHWGVEPDIVCLAKGIASGLPLGAFIARAEQMSWPPGSHGSTFGGNPLACAAGLATLDLLEDGLMENAARVGAQLHDGLREIASSHQDVTDVRGLGLMLALEFKTPEQAAKLVQSAFERGLLLLTAGIRAVRISPPLVLNPDDAATGLEIIASALA